MTKKGWIIFSLLCVMILGGLIFLSQKDKADVSNIDYNQIQAPSPSNGQIGDHVLGKADSKVVLIEYGDFQCAGCGTAAPIIKQISEKYKNQIAVVFRNMPLTANHPNALASSAAAEAAGLQGKYWEMHTKLFSDQNSWNRLTGENRTNYFVSLAEELELNKDQFIKDIDSDNVSKKIAFDRALAAKRNVTATPSIYLNGDSVSDLYSKDGALVSSTTDGARVVWSDFDAMDKLVIQPALKKNNISLPE